MLIMAAGSKTLREIQAQPGAWRATLCSFKAMRENTVSWYTKMRPETLVLTGCGTSYYLSQAGAAAFGLLAHECAVSVPGSELFLQPDLTLPATGKVLVIGVSRSGESSETVRALTFVKESGRGRTAALTCYPESSLAHEADVVWGLPAAQEESVVMTQSFTSMLLFLDLLAGTLGQEEKVLDEFELLPQLGQELLERYSAMIEALASEPRFDRFIFLGSGPFFGLAQEGMLKLKEQAISWSEAYHSLEVRHGPKSIIDDKTLVVSFPTPGLWPYEGPLLQELKSYGAEVLTLGAGEAVSDWNIALPAGLNIFARGLAVMPLVQLLGFHRALARGLDPDVPQHLTQVVKL